MINLTSLLISFIILNNSLIAQEVYNLVKEGNEQYIAGNFELAIEKYNAVLDSGYESPELYFNLGNAYYKSHKLTMALVQYERARLLDPRDDEINHNLEIARQYVVDEIDVLPEFLPGKWYKDFISLYSSDQWSVISMGSFILALALLLLYLFAKSVNIRKFGFWLAITMLIISSGSYVFAYHQKRSVYENNYAIVFSPSVTIKGAPDQNGTDLFQLHEGTKIEIIDQLGDWREIRLSDGNVGWLRKEVIIKL